MGWFEGFEKQTIALNSLPVTLRRSDDWTNDKPVLVLLHGFPQTHVLWHRVAQQLKDRFRIVMPDLRGYGDSSHESGDAEHAHYSKRAMAAEVVGLLDVLGGGHNGLTSAAYLAKANKSVLVLEALTETGGGSGFSQVVV